MDDARIYDALMGIRRVLERLATAIERAHNVEPCFGLHPGGCDAVGVEDNAPGYRDDLKFCAKCMGKIRTERNETEARS